MTFAKLSHIKFNVSEAGSDLIMIKYWMECIKNGTAGDVTIDRILDYCNTAIKEIEEAQNCLIAEVDKILEGEKNDNM